MKLTFFPSLYVLKVFLLVEFDTLIFHFPIITNASLVKIIKILYRIYSVNMKYKPVVKLHIYRVTIGTFVYKCQTLLVLRRIPIRRTF